jgi:hypothetical protein
MDSLKEWLILYLKNRDIILRKILNISEKEDVVTIKFKDKEQTFFILPSLSLPDLSKAQNPAIVCLNTKVNFNFLLTNWEKLASFKSLSLYFVNPKSRLEKRWILFPFTHHSIADNESLKLGLMAMFETVDEA